MLDDAARAAVLAAYGAGPAEQAELLAYNANRFVRSPQSPPPLGERLPTFPLPPEPHLTAWTAYAEEAATRGAWPVLQERLVQLRFPIAAGMREHPDYQAATRRGVDPATLPAATGLTLRRPDLLQWRIHPSAAGPIPAILPGDRADFVTLVQALTGRNEPVAVPDSMGASMIAGLNNWDRLHLYRRAWQAEHPGENWSTELARLPKALYQDRLLLCSDGPYSGVPAAALGLDAATWRAQSLAIRLAHESAHYFTRRVFDLMQTNALDETIADFMGLTAAQGRFTAAPFLRFLGLEAFPAYREGGRLQNYRGSLSDGAFRVLCALVHAAAGRLETWAAAQPRATGPADEARLLLTLTGGTLESWAVGEGLA
jgi:hypothetical protein